MSEMMSSAKTEKIIGPTGDAVLAMWNILVTGE